MLTVSAVPEEEESRVWSRSGHAAKPSCSTAHQSNTSVASQGIHAPHAQESNDCLILQISPVSSLAIQRHVGVSRQERLCINPDLICALFRGDSGLICKDIGTATIARPQQESHTNSCGSYKRHLLTLTTLHRSDRLSNHDIDHETASKPGFEAFQGNNHDSIDMGQMTSHILGHHHKLCNTIKSGHFWAVDEFTLLDQIKDCFPEELDRLKAAPASEKIPTDAYNGPQQLTPSMILFDDNFDEINRTLVGILALRWIHNNEYDKFTSNQLPKLRLKRSSFAWLRHHFQTHLHTTDDLLMLVISMIINDVGKDSSLEREYHALTQHHIPDQNHDSILYEAAKAGMIPSLNLLSSHQRSDLLLGLELGSELNAGQLAQAESVPINLEFLQQMKGREHAFEMKFMEQILDVAGALGHFDSSGAKNMIEPVFEAFQTVHEVSIKIIEGRLDLRQGYDEVLKKRGALLNNIGFRRLSTSNKEERALLRLLTMGRTVDVEQAELFSKAFHALESKWKDALVRGLNIDGNVNETAVLPYYMPAIISEVLTTTKDQSEEGRQRALMSLMRYLAKVLDSSSVAGIAMEDGTMEGEGSVGSVGDGGGSESGVGVGVAGPVPGIVIEHNMMKAREVIGSKTFPLNPDKLDELDIPAGQLLQRRRTSHSL